MKKPKQFKVGDRVSYTGPIPGTNGLAVKAKGTILHLSASSSETYVSADVHFDKRIPGTGPRGPHIWYVNALKLKRLVKKKRKAA